MSPVKDVFTKCAYLFFHCEGEMVRSISDCARETVFKAFFFKGKNFLRNLGEREGRRGRIKGKGEETLT